MLGWMVQTGHWRGGLPARRLGWRCAPAGQLAAPESSRWNGAGSMDEHSQMFPISSGALSRKRRDLAPETDHAFREFSRQVFTAGALDAKTKQLMAVAVAHVTQCPYCIRGHTKGALQEGATEQEIMEAIWVAAEMRAGGSFAHSVIALQAMADAAQPAP